MFLWIILWSSIASWALISGILMVDNFVIGYVESCTDEKHKKINDFCKKFTTCPQNFGSPCLYLTIQDRKSQSQPWKGYESIFTIVNNIPYEFERLNQFFFFKKLKHKVCSCFLGWDTLILSYLLTYTRLV